MSYLWNAVKDCTYGYIEVKCCNSICNRVFKVSRNSETAKTPNNVSCNTVECHPFGWHLTRVPQCQS
jgi:hypothetical protein